VYEGRARALDDSSSGLRKVCRGAKARVPCVRLQPVYQSRREAESDLAPQAAREGGIEMSVESPPGPLNGSGSPPAEEASPRPQHDRTNNEKQYEQNYAGNGPCGGSAVNGGSGAEVVSSLTHDEQRLVDICKDNIREFYQRLEPEARTRLKDGLVRQFKIDLDALKENTGYPLAFWQHLQVQIQCPPKVEVVEAEVKTEEPEVEEENPFPLECLPESLRDFAQNVAAAIQVPVTIPTAAGLSIIASTLGKSLRVETNPGETMCGNLYILPIGESGTGKTRAAKQVMHPVYALHDRKQQEWKDKTYGELKAELDEISDEIATCRKKPKNVGPKSFRDQDPSDPTEIRTKLADLYKREAEVKRALKMPEFYTSTTTEAKLSELLADNHEVMYSVSSEAGDAIQILAGKYSSMKGANNTEDTLMLSGFSQERYKRDRKDGGSYELREPTINLLWLVQPRYIPTLFGNESLYTGGFLARCLTFNSGAKFETITGNEPAISGDLAKRFYDRVNHLYEAYLLNDSIHIVKPSQGAREAMRRYRNQCGELQNEKLRDIGQFPARWTENAWRVALGLHAVEYLKGATYQEMTVETVNKAICIVQWFSKEFLKLVEFGREEQADSKAESLFKYMAKHKTSATFRDLRGWTSGHGNMNTAQLEALVKANPLMFRLDGKTVHKLPYLTVR
jgi:uncharacterized protein DUF3987